MARIRVALDQDQQRIVDEERSSHPNPRIRERMLALWLLHHGVKRQDAAKIVVGAHAPNLLYSKDVVTVYEPHASDP
jgi:hypothetical protein